MALGWPRSTYNPDARAQTLARSASRCSTTGLRVLIQEVHTAPLASVWCWYRVGSKDERRA